MLSYCYFLLPLMVNEDFQLHRDVPIRTTVYSVASPLIASVPSQYCGTYVNSASYPPGDVSVASSSAAVDVVVAEACLIALGRRRSSSGTAAGAGQIL